MKPSWLLAALLGLLLWPVIALVFYDRVLSRPVGDPPGTTTEITLPSSITAVTPLQVCENALKEGTAGKGDAVGGVLYEAVWGDYKVKYRLGDRSFGFFFENEADYPEIDEKTLTCLEKAPVGLPE